MAMAPGCVFLLLLPALALAGHGQGPLAPAVPRLRALLAGIDRLPPGPRPRRDGDPDPLRWAEGDARAVAHLLRTRFGAGKGDVRELAGSQATRASLLAALRQHFEGLEEGDAGLFYFSGHGTAVPDEPGGDEADGYDEALVTADPPGLDGATVVVTDDEVHDLFLDALARRKVHAVLILDCCHSGALFRSDLGPAKGLGPRRGALEEFAPFPSGTVGLFACRPDQEAREREGHGFFTGALLEELAIASGSATTYRELLTRVQARMGRSAPPLARHQVPAAGGEEGSLLFARPLPGAPQRAVLLEAAAGAGWIDRGEVDSPWYHPGQLLAVFSLDPATYAPVRLGTAEVLQTFGLKSAIRLRSGAMEAGCFVEPLGGQADAPRIRVQIHGLPESSRKEVLSRLQGFEEAVLVPPGLDADVVLKGEGGAIRAWDGAGSRPLDLHRGGPGWEDQRPRGWMELLQAMAVWRRWAAVRGLAPNPGLRIRLFRVRGETREPLEPDREGRYTASVGDLLDLEAGLAEGSEGPWHLYPFCLGEGYEYGLLDSQETDRRLWRRTRLLHGIRIAPPPGWDRLLLFTSRSSDLAGRFPDSTTTWRGGRSGPLGAETPLRLNLLLLRVLPRGE